MQTIETAETQKFCERKKGFSLIVISAPAQSNLTQPLGSVQNWLKSGVDQDGQFKTLLFWLARMRITGVWVAKTAKTCQHGLIQYCVVGSYRRLILFAESSVLIWYIAHLPNLNPELTMRTLFTQEYHLTLSSGRNSWHGQCDDLVDDTCPHHNLSAGTCPPYTG